MISHTQRRQHEEPAQADNSPNRKRATSAALINNKTFSFRSYVPDGLRHMLVIMALRRTYFGEHGHRADDDKTKNKLI